MIILWTKLFTGTVPANKNSVTGTVPANKNYVTGIVKKWLCSKKKQEQEFCPKLQRKHLGSQHSRAVFRTALPLHCSEFSESDKKRKGIYL